MVGADPVKIQALAEETTLPGEIRRTCGWDYDQSIAVWETVLMPHRPAADQPKARIEVIYRTATGNLEVYGQVFRNLRFLETIAELAADRFAWRAPIVMEMRSCGDAGAEWTVPTRTLHVCYEMAQDLAELYRELGTVSARSRRRVGEVVAMQTAMRICPRSDKAVRFLRCAVAVPLQSEARIPCIISVHQCGGELADIVFSSCRCRSELAPSRLRAHPRTKFPRSFAPNSFAMRCISRGSVTFSRNTAGIFCFLTWVMIFATSPG